MAQELVGELGLRERVHFTGATNDLASVFRRAHLYLLLSDYESFGLSALEAMACGAPAVVSAAGGLPEVVHDGDTGLLCPVGDVQYTAGKIVRLLREPDRWSAMSGQAAERVGKEFTTERIIPMYEALYEKALSEGEAT
jgi:glycosyltransferase involved in cell wall biosynthesis